MRVFMNKSQRHQIDSGRLQMNRRRFADICVSAGLGATILPEALTALAQDAEDITPGMVAAAEKIAGLHFTQSERESIVERLNNLRETYGYLRTIDLDNGIPPAVVFNPVLPGMKFSSERKPFTVSRVNVTMPGDRKSVV